MVKLIVLLLACVVPLLAAPALSTKPSFTLENIAFLAKNYTLTLPKTLLLDTFVADLSDGQTKHCAKMIEEGLFCSAEGILAKLNKEKLVRSLVQYLQVHNEETHKKGECQEKTLKKNTHVDGVPLRALLQTLLKCVQYVYLSSPSTTTNKP